MAKKKKEAEPIQEFDAVDALYDKITKDYGDGVLTEGLRIVDENKTTIPIGMALDLVCGGIEEGSWVGVSGPPKTCKTTMCLSFAANCQKSEYGARPIFYGDVEHRITKKHLQGIQGLNLKKPFFNLIQSTKERILSQQDHLNLYSHILRTIPNAVLIIDSVSAFVEEKVLNSDVVGVETRGGSAKIFSQFISQMRSVVPVNNAIVLGITQRYSNTSGMGAAFNEKAAEAWKYQCDYQLYTKRATEWKASDKTIGFLVDWVCKTSKTGLPVQAVQSYIRFGLGVDSLYESMIFAETARLVKKSGSWYTLTFLQNHLEWNAETEKSARAQGGEGVYKLLQQNPQWVKWLQDDVYEMLTGNAREG